jgi:hypothetical protein
MPNPNVKYPINMDTYNIRFAKLDIENSIKYIKLLFRNNIIYTLKQIETFVISKIPNINELFIYKALDIIANNKEEIVYDKFSRKGYIIYRGDYYIFQPFDLERDDIPLIYRMYPESYKPHTVNLENINLDYINNIIQDLKNSDLKTKQDAWNHWIVSGIKENRFDFCVVADWLHDHGTRCPAS